MEFTYDLSQTPIIGRRQTGGNTGEATRPKDPFTAANEADASKAAPNKEEKTTGASSPRRSVSLSSADSSSISGWKRPWLSQVMPLSLQIVGSRFQLFPFKGSSSRISSQPANVIRPTSRFAKEPIGE